MKKFRVLMIGSLPPDLTSVKGGVETAILNLLAGLKMIDEIEIIFVSFTKSIKQIKKVFLNPNIEIYFMPYRFKFQLPDYILNKKQLQKLIAVKNPQIIHIQSSSALLLRVIGYSKSNIVVTQHGIVKEEMKYVKGTKRRLKFLFRGVIQKYYFPRFNNLIFISNYNKNLFSRKNYNSEIIHNAVNPLFFKQNIKSNRINSLIFVAGLRPLKNLELALDSLNVLNKEDIRFSLDVVGDFVNEKYRELIYHTIEKYDLQSQVTFHGWLDQTQLIKVYQNCSIFILTSKQETLPVSIAEAMALGRVVVATDVGAVSEMFDDGSSGFLIKNDNLDSLNRILKKLYNNVALTNYISENAKKLALTKFHPLSVATKTVNFYKRLAEKNH